MVKIGAELPKLSQKNWGSVFWTILYNLRDATAANFTRI